MKKWTSLAVLTLALGGLPALAAPDYDYDEATLDQYLVTIKADLMQRRDAALRTLLQMSEPEAQAFWPLQKAYDKEAADLGQKRRDLLVEFLRVRDNLTAQLADELSDRLFQFTDDRIALHHKYYKLMSEKVSTVIAVQFLQLQNQFETMGDVKMASYVPLAAAGKVDDSERDMALSEYLETAKGDLGSSRDAAVDDLIKLEGPQLKEFISLEKAYDRERAKLDKTNEKLLNEYRSVHTNLTPKTADDLADRFFSLDDQAVALHRKYFQLMSEKVSTVAAVQFLQIQRRFETLAALQAATYVPLAGG